MNEAYKDQFKPWNQQVSAISCYGLVLEVQNLVIDKVSFEGDRVGAFCVLADVKAVNAINRMIDGASDS